ncbi:MAG: hypothetical protein H6716_28275 [Polyangiaceae bacterium]|nr:hypothetical protein [Polyangiaceae bacterium]
MDTTTSEEVLEGIERVIVAAPLSGTDRPVPVYFNDEAGMVRRDADRVFTVFPVADQRLDKRSGGSIYRLLTASVAIQYFRNRRTRAKQLADALVLEDELRHLAARLTALARPVLGVRAARIIDGPRFDSANSVLGANKTMTIFGLEAEYVTGG